MIFVCDKKRRRAFLFMDIYISLTTTDLGKKTNHSNPATREHLPCL